MKAIIARGDAPGGRLEYSDWPDPVPGPGEVVVEVRAAGVNNADLLLRRGVFGRLPAIPGIDAAGTIAERGPEVTDIPVGTRVLVNPVITCGQCEYCLSGNHGTCRDRLAIGQALDGSYAQYLRIPRRNVYPIRAEVSFEEAAAVPVAFLTAWQMLMMRAHLRPAETVLIAAAASGVGSAAVQIARLVGARVVAAAGNERKLQAARSWGADAAINYCIEDLGERLLEVTGGKGVDVVVDTIGGSMWGHYLKGLRAAGRLVTCSFTGGREPQVDLLTVMSKQLSIFGAGSCGSGPAVVAVVKLINDRRLAGVVDQVLALQDAERAHELLRQRAVIGKVILQP